MTRKASGAIALAVGALLVFAGCGLELYRLEGPSTPGSGGFGFTPWSVEFKSERAPSGPQPSPQWGYALVVAGVLAAFAALTPFRSARLAIVGRVAAALAIGVVGATAWAVATTVIGLFGGGREPSPKYHWVIGAGLWTLITACVVLLVGTLLVQDWPPRAPRPEGPVVYQLDADDDTPPFGIPVPGAAATAPSDTAAGLGDASGAGSTRDSSGDSSGDFAGDSTGDSTTRPAVDRTGGTSPDRG
ncbi:hypothetical protein ABZ816_21525 [Actinosynnema sp. NPDC047251]|uniref:Putative secreted protein n=1 Tax=Saccharothrix espanaensis (strain ATCC 51144 / DSM 44229 / JCM 9112 / NBRC 15066 / NRRL 15764) TaxID=1179773 RepID=K0KB15_SACES|nr:hypothetical protein [Saccharothrix espanaensis]CCH33818.1 putative secreted protein [Saccharothrix espanaensis DSM 44229]